MSPTWFELTVAVLLLFIAFRIGMLLTPWVIARWRHWLHGHSAAKFPDSADRKTNALENRTDK